MLFQRSLYEWKSVFLLIQFQVRYMSKDYEAKGYIIDFILYFFLSHHGVLKKNTLKPKLRTVFNGSANVYDGISLNSLLHTGPNLLPDLAELLIHWMKYHFVFVS